MFLSQREALEQAFPDADRIEQQTYLLDDAQAEAISKLARSRLESRLIKIHTGRRGDEILGHAFIDVHRVRTLPEAFLVVLTPEGKVRSLRLLAFYEPPEYAPPERWLRLFDDKRLDPALKIGGDIHVIAGSTLSSRAVTDSVRRSLAAFEVLVRRDPAVAVREPPAAGKVGGGGGGR